jgi:diguanylate cyclase (GGDEF)-like protein
MQNRLNDARLDRANLLALDEIFKNTKQGLIGQIAAVSFMVFIIKDFLSATIVLMWLGAQLLNFLIRIFIILRYKKVRQEIQNYSQAKCWLKYYMVSMLITSLLWGISALFIEDISHDYHFLMYAVLIGLSFASIATLGFVLEVYMAYVIPMLSILFLSFATYEDIVGQIAGFFIFVSYAYAHMSVVQFSRNFKSAHIDKELAEEAKKDLIEQAKKLEYMAHHDSLTGLPNRASFHERFSLGLVQSKRSGTMLALFFLDIDNFKEINDTLGHEVGDAILIAFTNRIQSVMREEDTVSRLGGDEFTVIMQDLKNPEDASLLATKMIDSLLAPIRIKENALHITTSIGISLYPNDSQSAEELLIFADKAMYKAKGGGGNRYYFHSL